MSVKVENITKLYGSQKALDQVSFTAKKGEIIGFLGPNGAGKSTMMKIITCFIPQTEGKVEVCNFDINENPLEVRRKIGYLPEHNPLYLDMYVKEYLEFVGGVYEIKNLQERIKEMIKMTGLEVEQKKKLGALSKGYRQRVGLAQALIHDPEVLILDEPTSGLDPNQLSEIRALITKIGKEKTVILSTHIMQEVKAMCDRVIIINKGKIVANEKTEFLQSGGNTQHVVIVEFDKPLEKADFMTLPCIQSAELVGPNKWKIIGKGTEDTRGILFKFAVDRQLTVYSLQKEEQSLEEIFHQLTR